MADGILTPDEREELQARYELYAMLVAVNKDRADAIALILDGDDELMRLNNPDA